MRSAVCTCVCWAADQGAWHQDRRATPRTDANWWQGLPPGRWAAGKPRRNKRRWPHATLHMADVTLWHLLIPQPQRTGVLRVLRQLLGRVRCRGRLGRFTAVPTSLCVLRARLQLQQRRGAAPTAKDQVRAGGVARIARSRPHWLRTVEDLAWPATRPAMRACLRCGPRANRPLAPALQVT